MDGGESAADEIVCEISGGGLQGKLVHRVGVNYDRSGSQCLSSLSERLVELKDVLNRNLTELVDKEKGIVPSEDRLQDAEAEEDDSSDSGPNDSFASYSQ